jgi:hypothetical protein
VPDIAWWLIICTGGLVVLVVSRPLARLAYGRPSRNEYVAYGLGTFALFALAFAVVFPFIMGPSSNTEFQLRALLSIVVLAMAIAVTLVLVVSLLVRIYSPRKPMFAFPALCTLHSALRTSHSLITS